MKILAAAAFAVIALACTTSANAVPATGVLEGLKNSSSLVQQTGWYGRHHHRRCWWRHGHRHCRWW